MAKGKTANVTIFFDFDFSVFILAWLLLQGTLVLQTCGTVEVWTSQDIAGDIYYFAIAMFNKVTSDFSSFEIFRDSRSNHSLLL